MKILIHAIHYPVSSARYAVDAFRRIGHDVRHVGQETGREIWGITVAEKYIWKQEPPEDGWTPDLAILMDTAYQWHYPDDNVPTIVWSVDNHVRDLRQPGISHYFLAHRGVSMMAWEGDIQLGSAPPITVPRADMTWLPCAYDPTIFTPSPIPYAEREYDVCMIGVMYPQRWTLVNALKAAGLKVYAGTGLLFQDFRDAYWNSRISLCVSANGDVAQRVFETAAMGCLIVSDPCADFERLKPTGIKICAPIETIGVVQDLIRSPAYAQDFIEASMAWVRPHTWDARAQTIIDWYEKHTDKSLGAGQAGEAAHENV